jgi:peptidyl-prolyl cis-trans isomerase D
VQKEFDRFVTNRRLANEGEFDREAAIASGAHNQIVQSLAARSALDQESYKMGMSMPREMVREFLQSCEQFKNPRTGKFDNEALSSILREYNYSIREFEDRLQSDLLRNQLISAVSAGGTAPKGLVDALVLRETESRTISYLTITDDMAGEASAPTPQALQEFYKANSSQFMAPEYRTFSAVILKNSDYAEIESVSDVDLLKTYETNKARYETPERRTVYQITFQENFLWLALL